MDKEIQKEIGLAIMSTGHRLFDVIGTEKLTPYQVDVISSISEIYLKLREKGYSPIISANVSKEYSPERRLSIDSHVNRSIEIIEALKEKIKE